MHNVKKMLSDGLSEHEIKMFWDCVNKHRISDMPIEEGIYFDLSDLISHAFPWTRTSQGFEFWSDIEAAGEGES